MSAAAGLIVPIEATAFLINNNHDLVHSKLSQKQNCPEKSDEKCDEKHGKKNIQMDRKGHKVAKKKKGR